MKLLIKIINYLTPNNDKLAHFFWGFIYSAIGYVFQGLILMLLLSLIFGVLKEFYDKKNKGNFDFLDILFTTLPSLIILIIIHI